MTRSKPRIVTGLMLGTFLALGVDTLIIVGVLWYVGQIPKTTAATVSVAVLSVFALWVLGRWIRLRGMDQFNSNSTEDVSNPEHRDPLERLKQRYAEGELSDAEFEKRLETLLDADHRAESSVDTSIQQLEQSREE